MKYILTVYPSNALNKTERDSLGEFFLMPLCGCKKHIIPLHNELSCGLCNHVDNNIDRYLYERSLNQNTHNMRMAFKYVIHEIMMCVIGNALRSIKWLRFDCNIAAYRFESYNYNEDAYKINQALFEKVCRGPYQDSISSYFNISIVEDKEITNET